VLDHRVEAPVIRDRVPVYSQTFPRTARSAGPSRRAASTVLTAWALPDLVDDARLILDELVANAADHAQGTSIRVTITRTARGRVRLAVIDMDRKRPVLRTVTANDEGGRGLRLVDELSDRWGVDPLPWGKRVWAELSVTP